MHAAPSFPSHSGARVRVVPVVHVWRVYVCAHACSVYIYIYLNRCVCVCVSARARMVCACVCMCTHACVGALTKKYHSNTIEWY